MKKLFLVLSAVVLSMTALAIPAKPGLWKTIKLADGTEVRAELCGDEFCNYYRSEDGRKFVRDTNTGLYITADIERMQQSAMQKRLVRQPAGLSKSPAAKTGTQVSYTGTKKGLIILVQFADLKFNEQHTPELYNRIVNERGFTNEMGFAGSVKDYFWDQSYGTMEFDFDIKGPVTMPQGYAYYGQNTDGSSNANIGELVVEACKAVDDETDFSAYDWDGDGEVEQVFIIFAGHGEASYAKDPDTIWPHKWDIYSATYSADPDNPVILYLDNMLVNTYACSCELGATENIDGIGTICHEFSHCLGLPDMYDTQYGGEYGMSVWDLMCGGNYNGDSFYPAGYTAYERMAVGWIQPVELKENQQVDDMKPLGESGEAYIIYNDGNSNEYYMLENRRKSGWDSALPGSGLLITHVDYNAQAWNYNVVNSITGQTAYGIRNPHQHCHVVPADNNTNDTSTDIGNDLWPYNYNNNLTNTTTPAAITYNANSDGSLFLNKSVRDITRNNDGTISFTFENENASDTDYNLPQSYLFYESFDQCNGKGGNDGSFNVSTTGSIVYDNVGWSTTSGRSAYKCALFGSTLAGQATTPYISIDGEYTLLFKAAPYTGDGTTLTLEVTEGDATLSKSTFVMKENNWSAFSTTVNGTGDIRLKFKATKRFYLDKVCLASDIISGVSSVEAENTADGIVRVYTTDGILVYSAAADRFSASDIPARGLLIIKGNGTVRKVFR